METLLATAQSALAQPTVLDDAPPMKPSSGYSSAIKATYSTIFNSIHGLISDDVVIDKEKFETTKMSLMMAALIEFLLVIILVYHRFENRNEDPKIARMLRGSTRLASEQRDSLIAIYHLCSKLIIREHKKWYFLQPVGVDNEIARKAVQLVDLFGLSQCANPSPINLREISPAHQRSLLAVTQTEMYFIHEIPRKIRIEIQRIPRSVGLK